MIKIVISGKQGVGKNQIARLIESQISAFFPKLKIFLNESDDGRTRPPYARKDPDILIVTTDEV